MPDAHVEANFLKDIVLKIVSVRRDLALFKVFIYHSLCIRLPFLFTGFSAMLSA